MEKNRIQKTNPDTATFTVREKRKSETTIKFQSAVIFLQRNYFCNSRSYKIASWKRKD